MNLALCLESVKLYFSVNTNILDFLRRRKSQILSHNLYENLPVKSKMAFVSRILILLATCILLYGQYLHHTQASIICTKMQFLSAQ